MQFLGMVLLSTTASGSLMARSDQYAALVSSRVLYNGHKRVHALKFQSVVLPSGMIAHMYGPVGKLNDKLQTVNKQQNSA